MSRYIALRLGGTRTVHVSRAALESARRRAVGKRTIVDSWHENDPPPFDRPNDAGAWDDYRARRGAA